MITERRQNAPSNRKPAKYPEDLTVEDRPFTDSTEFKIKFLELEARLRAAEEEVRQLRELQKGEAGVSEALSSRFEVQNLVQRMLLRELSRQGDTIQEEAALTRQILDSRIWRTLVWLAGLFLRFTLQTSQSRNPPGPPSDPRPAETPTLTRPPSVSCASAARHTSGEETIDRWKEIVCDAVNTRIQPKLSQPRISVITPARNTRVAWFAEAAISLLEQSCPEWEWCIVDDSSTERDFHALFPVVEATDRVKVRGLGRDQGISGATNEGLRIASGEYVCFMDHDDLLAPNALAECLTALDRGLDAVYTDHDKVDDAGIRKDAFYKPDWSPEYFRGAMYICHLLCVRRDIALEIVGFDPHFDGVQDFEFMLRYSERTQRIGHLPEILYHWRTAPGSVAASQDAKGDLGELQKEAVLAHLKRLHLPAVVEPGPTTHCVQLVPLPLDRQPRVSIIIPTKDAPDLLEKCLSSVSKKSTYSNFEIICVDNGTADSRALSLMKSHAAKRILFRGDFNFSRAINLGAQHAEGEFLMFMHNDMEVITDDWMEAMLYYARQNDVGAVGGLLQYPDGTVQHAGIVLGGRGTAAHVLRKAPADSTGYWGVLCCAREVSAVTAASMMVRRETFEKTGGLYEQYSAVYQDVDFCLRLRSSGLRNIYTPRARFFHLESGSGENDHNLHDGSLLLERWGHVIASSDPYYNRNLDLGRCDYTVTPS